MTDHHYDIDRDLKEAEAMAKSLDRYVYQEQLYGTVGGGGFFAPSNMPSLTVGAVLLRTRRLTSLREAGQLDEKQSDRLDKVLAINREVYKDARREYEHKMMREAKSRLKAMQLFFEECSGNPKLCNRVYRPEALRRTIVQEILIAMDEMSMERDEELNALLSRMDSNLRRYADEEHGFLLDDELESVYPQRTFWWLYREPHTPEK
ncbi:MAG: hypothetical protein ACOCYT_00250 [Chloroflexota bacterium]